MAGGRGGLARIRTDAPAPVSFGLMGFFKKKADPISDRARFLNAEIAALESRIKQLDAQLRLSDSGSRSHAATASVVPKARASNSTLQKPRVPVFEVNDYQQNKVSLDQEATPQHFNDLGVRKYDLAAAFRRIKHYFRGPNAHNPKLVSYLAAGSIKGLRPLRYEKRVARNRFVALFVILLLLSWGIATVLSKR